MERLRGKALPDKGGLLKPGIFSLLLHIGLVVILILSARSTITKVGPSVYRVTLHPFSPPGSEIQQGSPAQGLPGLPGGLSAPAIAEKPKPDENLKRTWNVESKKPPQKKVEKREEKTEKGEKLEKGKGTRKSLQEAIEDIHREVALEKIQKRVASRERLEKGQREESSTTHLSQGPIVSGPRTGTGSGSGMGTESGSGGFSTGGLPGGSPGGSSVLEAKLNDYYSMIWTKIKKEWTLPENLPKGKIDLEAIIVVIIEKDGKVQKSWFEKKSGNALYDQRAMRAIKKAEPFPPIPREFSDERFEIGIRFHPD